MNKITDKDNWFFKICDRDKVSIDELIRFHNLPYKNKISFGITPIDKDINHITITENDNNKSVPDGVTLYKISHKYFDPLEWVNSGKVKQTRYNKIKNALIRNS